MARLYVCKSLYKKNAQTPATEKSMGIRPVASFACYMHKRDLRKS